MKLITKQLFFQDLYSASKKLVISGQDSVFFQDNFKLPDEISVYEFTYDLPSQQGKITVLGEDGSFDLVEMQLAPNFFLGLFVFSESAKQELEEAFESGEQETVRNACINVMSIHESARERLVVLSEAYYQRIFEITGVPKIITDLACAFHPFCFPWMNLPKEVEYNAYDINKNFVDLINHYFALEGIQPLAHWQDIYSNPPAQHADVAFLFKMYHCLDHRKKGSGLEIIRNTKTDWMVISFPLQNLRGAKMIMYDRYSQPIEQLVESEGWSMHRLEFENEWLVLIHKA